MYKRCQVQVGEFGRNIAWRSRGQHGLQPENGHEREMQSGLSEHQDERGANQKACETHQGRLSCASAC